MSGGAVFSRRIVPALGTVALVTALLLTSCSNASGTTPPAASPGEGSWQQISASQLHDMMAKQSVYLVNVHVPYEGEIPGTSAFIPYTDIAGRLGDLPFGKEPVVIYCRTGNMSGEAAAAMVAAGAPPFYELSGGFYAWQAAGYPLDNKQG
jgi:rhodanese-related sulfurtransferase